MTVARPTIRPDLIELSGYHSPQVAVAVRLNTNESPYPPPPAWQAALAEQVAAIEFNRYPDRTALVLRTALADLHGVGPDQVLVGKGSNEVLAAVCMTFGGQGRTAAVFEPTYALHSHIPNITGTAVAVGERAADLNLDPAEVRRVLSESDPAITFLCSPNNPTGLVDPPDIVEEVIAAAPGVVVVDEAYAQFAPWSALSLPRDGRPLVVTRTFSKTWAMAACRLGYLIAPPDVVAAIEKVLLPYHLDAVTQAAGVLALDFADDMEVRVSAIVAERERLIANLVGLDVDWWPSQANFVLFRPRSLGGQALWERLLKRSVLVRDFSSRPRLRDCLRVTVGTPAENDAFLLALKESLTE